MATRFGNFEIKRFILMFCVLGTGLLDAQVTGTLSGYVRDPSGAAIPNAAVTATMVEQKTAATAQSDAQGFYSFPALSPGHYDVAFQAQGFQTQVNSAQELTIGQN